MRLAKLSIATIVTAGALTGLSASSLEEAIKGVDISGLVRARYQNDNHAAGDFQGGKIRFSGNFTLTAPIADNLTSVLTARYHKWENFQNDGTASDSPLAITQAYFQYTQNAFVFKAGKMQLPIPWAEDSWDGDFGNGVLATYSGVESWTFLVGAYFNTNLGGRINEYEIYNSPLSEYPQGSSSIYTAAALGSISIVDAQLWLGRVESNIDYMALLQLSTDHAGFDATVQVQQTKLKGETQTALNLSEDKGIFWAAKAGYTFAGLRVGAGYISNDKDQPVYTLSADGQNISAGQQLYIEITNRKKARTWFATANYEFDKFGIGAGYAKAKADSQSFGNEWYIEGSYAYTKNFTLSGYYSDMKLNNPDNAVYGALSADHNKEIRFQATYSF